MAITPQNPGVIGTPNSVSSTSQTAISVPNSVSGTAQTAISVPNSVSGTAQTAISVPNSVSGTAQTAISVPNSVSGTAQTAISVPNALAATGQPVLPRTLTPTVDLNYAQGLFAQNGVGVVGTDLITYSRNSSATYLDRFLNTSGDWTYFVNTDFVGSFGNSFTYSEQFDNAAWTKSAATITANNTKDPLSGLTADKLEAGSTASITPTLYQGITTTASSSYTISLFVKSAEALFLQIGFQAGDVTGNPRVNFDLNAGVIGLRQSGIDSASITPVGNDWFRISCTVTAVGVTLQSEIILIKTASDTTSTNAWTAGEGLYIWGAQVTALNYMSPYVKTAATIPNETFSETQRIEYDAATGECLGALIESASTNLCLRSEEFDNASWSKSNSTITANDTLAPDNSTSADKLEAASSSTIAPNIIQSITTTEAASYTISTYAKRAEASFIQFNFGSAHVANDPRVNFDLSTGVIGSQDADIDAASIIPVGNDWFRISATVEAVGTSLQSYFYTINSATDTRNQTNAWTAGDGLHIWGAQIEAQAAPTSYIPTTTAAVSRLADLVSIPTAGNVSSGDITFHVQAETGSDTGVGSDLVFYEVKSTAQGLYAFLRSSDGALQHRVGGTTNTLKAGGSKGSSYSFTSVFDSSSNTLTGFFDKTLTSIVDAGVLVSIDFSGVIGVGANASAAEQLNGHIKRFTIYNKALTAQEVAQL